MVHDHGRAEDVTQEVFISALRRMRATDAAIIFKPWIYEIAKNACIDAFRRSKRAEEVSYDADEGALDRSRLVSKSPTPDAAVDQRIDLENLQGAFGGLSEAHHQILVMRELEGLSYAQIGERLGMSRPSVESTLFRARRRLSEEYEELVSGERCRRVQAIIAESAEGRLGVRDRRKMARHVSHCQPCRRAACLAGVALDAPGPRRIRERLAALLPIPAFLRRRFGGGADHATAAHSVTFGQWSSALADYSDPAMSGWARAAVVAAGVAVAGLGTGAAAHHGRLSSSPHHQAVAVTAQKAPAGARRSVTGRPGAISGAAATHGAPARAARRLAARSRGTTAPHSTTPASSSASSSAPAQAPAAPSTSSTASAPVDAAGSKAPAPATASVTVALPSLPTGSAPATAPPVSVAVAAPAVDAAVDAVDSAANAAGSTVGGVTNGATKALGGG